MNTRIIAALTILGLLIVACAGTPPTPPTQVPVAQTPSTSSGPVVISLWHVKGGGTGEVLAKQVAEFNRTHPNIQVQAEFQGGVTELAQKILAGASTNTLPTMAEVGTGGYAEKYYLEGLLRPFDELITTDQDKAVRADLWDFMLEELTVQQSGKKAMVAWPFAKSMPIVYYNADLLKEAGIAAPAATWDEFAQQLATLKSKTSVKGGYAAKIDAMTVFAPTGFAYNCEFIAADWTKAKFNDPACMKVVEYYLDLIKNGSMYTTREYAEQTVEFANKRIAYTIQSIAAYPNLIKSVGGAFQVGVAPMFSGPSGRVNTYFGTNVVIFKSSPEKEKAAWEFLKWWSGDQNAPAWASGAGYFPVLKSLANAKAMDEVKQKSPNIAVAMQSLPARTMPTRAAWYEIEPIFIDAFNKVLTTGADPQKTFDDTVKKSDQILGTYAQ